MITIKAYLNGEQLAIAGDEKLRLLLGTVAIFTRNENEYEMHLELGGVTNESGHINWLSQKEFRNGDTITFKIGGSEAPTLPARITEPKSKKEIGILEWQKAKEIYEAHRHTYENIEE